MSEQLQVSPGPNSSTRQNLPGEVNRLGQINRSDATEVVPIATSGEAGQLQTVEPIGVARREVARGALPASRLLGKIGIKFFQRHADELERQVQNQPTFKEK